MRYVEKYRDEANELLRDSDLFEIPINIEDLAKKLNIEVRYKDLNKLSGVIKYTPSSDKVIITINSNDFELRQRFTLAHEIAHYIHDINFEKEKKIEDTISSQTHFRKEPLSPIERRADKFASDLLMPNELFKKEVKSIVKKLFPDRENFNFEVREIYKIVKDTSKLFGVSKPAVIYKFKSLKITDEKLTKELFNYHYEN